MLCGLINYRRWNGMNKITSAVRALNSVAENKDHILIFIMLDRLYVNTCVTYVYIFK